MGSLGLVSHEASRGGRDRAIAKPFRQRRACPLSAPARSSISAPRRRGRPRCRRFWLTTARRWSGREFYIPNAGRGGTTQHIELPRVIGSERKRHGLDRHLPGEHGDSEEIRAKFVAALAAELQEHKEASTLLFTSEYLFSSTAKEVRAYRDLTSAFACDFHVIMYLRRQDQWLASLTLQARKTGARPDFELNRGSPARFIEGVRAWSTNSDAVFVRRLSSEFLVGGDLIDDFCATLGLSIDGMQRRPSVSNAALAQEQVELVDRLNEMVGDLTFQNQLLIRSRFLALCGECLGGTPIEFARSEALEIFESFKPANTWLRQNFAGYGPPLFFNEDFSRYVDQPDNSRRYTDEQIRILARLIERQRQEKSLPADPDGVGGDRASVVDRLLRSFVGLRLAELGAARRERLRRTGGKRQTRPWADRAAAAAGRRRSD